MKRILVTGGCGFIGSNFIQYILQKDSSIFITNLDKLTYAGNLMNLSSIPTDANASVSLGKQEPP